VSDLSSLLQDQEDNKAIWQREPKVLLHPQIPKPMHGIAPRVVLGEEWWDQERRKAYASTNYHCVACGVHKTQALEHQWLEGHEYYTIDYAFGRMRYHFAVPLCHYCHNYIHQGRMEMLLEDKQMTQLKYDSIIHHGNKILRAAKLKKPKPYNGPCAKWADWRLVVYGVEYPPLIKSYTEWMKKYQSANCEDDE